MELHGGTVPVDKRAKPEVDEVALKRTEMVHSRARLSNFLWDSVSLQGHDGPADEGFL